MRSRVAWMAFVIVSILGCGEDETVDDEEISFELLTRGPICSRAESGPVVVRTADEWSVLWKDAMSHMPTGAGAPRVDFGRRMVLGSFLGDGPVGRDVTIVKVEGAGGRIVVTTATRTREGAEGTGTSPFMLVHVPWSSLDVEWREVERE